MSLLFDVDQMPVQHNEALEARRYGRLIYTKNFLETCPAAIEKLYTKIIPIDVRYDFARELFEVTAMSLDFDPVEPAYQIPYYGVQVKIQKRKSGSGRAYFISFFKADGE